MSRGYSEYERTLDLAHIIDNLPCEVLEELIVQKGLFANPFEDNGNGTLASSLEGMGGLDSSSRS